MEDLKILFDFGLSGLAIFAIILLVRSQVKATENQSSLIKVVGQQDAAYSRLNDSIDANTKATEAHTKSVDATRALTSQFTNEVQRTGDRVQQLHDTVIQQGNDMIDAMKVYSQEIPKSVFANSQTLANSIISELHPIPDQIAALSGKIDAQGRAIENAKGVIEQAPEAITVMVVSRLSNIIGTTQQQLDQLRTELAGVPTPDVIEKPSEA